MTATLATSLTRGQLAHVSGVGSETIRFYERQKLLPTPTRSAAGYRLYDQTTVERVNFICRAKALGFSLQEIAELLALQDDETHSDRAQIKALAERKLAEIDTKRRDLERMHAVLSALSSQCSGHGPLSGCPIIQALQTDPTPVSLNDHDPHC